MRTKHVALRPAPPYNPVSSARIIKLTVIIADLTYYQSRNQRPTEIQLMFLTKPDPNKPKTIEALIPMIDLFAVLAIVFMIYSSDEIIASQEQSQEMIEQITMEYKKLQEEVAAAEKARQERREILAQNAIKSLEEIEAEREQKSKELVTQFTQMLNEQRNQAAVEYERVVAKFELEQEREAQRQKAELEAEKQKEVESKVAELEQQKEAEVSSAKKELEQFVAVKEAQLEAELESQKQAAAQAAAEEAKQQTAAEAQQALAKELAAQQAELEAQKSLELAQAQAAAQQMAKAAAEAAEREVLKTAKQRAKAEVEAEHEKELTEQLAKLEAQKDAELQPLIEAEEARKEAQKVRDKIVERLLENFKDSDEGDVDIDGKTGKVRINFQESYFVRGSAELSDSMKELLRVMIPKYAKSIYENEGAAKQVESLKISGLTSPIFRGRYFDINDTSPEGEEAREYNLKLSNDRALAMYNFIFDANEMGDYEYRAQLKADLGIEALGYRTATPVPSELVGEIAACVKYDCKKEQASILEFRLYSEQSTSF